MGRSSVYLSLRTNAAAGLGCTKEAGLQDFSQLTHWLPEPSVQTRPLFFTNFPASSIFVIALENGLRYRNILGSPERHLRVYGGTHTHIHMYIELNRKICVLTYK